MPPTRRKRGWADFCAKRSRERTRASRTGCKCADTTCHSLPNCNAGPRVRSEPGAGPADRDAAAQSCCESTARYPGDTHHAFRAWCPAGCDISLRSCCYRSWSRCHQIESIELQCNGDNWIRKQREMAAQKRHVPPNGIRSQRTRDRYADSRLRRATSQSHARVRTIARPRRLSETNVADRRSRPGPCIRMVAAVCITVDRGRRAGITCSATIVVAAVDDSNKRSDGDVSQGPGPATGAN